MKLLAISSFWPILNSPPFALSWVGFFVVQKFLTLFSDEKARDIQIILNDSFKKSFELLDGVPRKWGKGDEETVKQLYKKSVVDTEKLLDIYSVIRLVCTRRVKQGRLVFWPAVF